MFYVFLTIGYFIVASSLILSGDIGEYVSAIPGNAVIDVIILFIIIPILTCIPLYFMKPLSILNFKILRKIQPKYDIYFIEFSQKSIASKHIIARALFPILIAISISLSLFNPIRPNSLFGHFVTPIINISLLLTPLIIIPFLPIWIFKDAGIVKILKKQKTRVPPELTYFGKTQDQLLKGYGGITTPILYVVTLIEIVSIDTVGLVILFYPLFLIGIYMPLMLLYESKIGKITEELKSILNLQPINLVVITNNLL